MAERRPSEAPARLERIGNAEAAEDRFERRPVALRRRDDERDLLRRNAVTQQVEQFLADELERASRACAFEKTDGASCRGERRGGLLEQRSLEMYKGRPGGGLILEAVGWQLGRATFCERREILGRPLQRRERGAPGFIRQRHVDLGPSGERLEQAPLGRGQILEAVREDGLSVPRVELTLQPLARAAPQEVAVPETETLELGAVGAVQRGELAVEIAGVEQAGLELGE